MKLIVGNCREDVAFGLPLRWWTLVESDGKAVSDRRSHRSKDTRTEKSARCVPETKIHLVGTGTMLAVRG